MSVLAVPWLIVKSQGFEQEQIISGTDSRHKRQALVPVYASYEVNGRRYYFFGDSKNFTEAHRTCDGLNAALVSIESENENDFLRRKGLLYHENG